MLVMIIVVNMMTTNCHDYGCRMIMIIMMGIMIITVMVAAVAACYCRQWSP